MLKKVLILLILFPIFTFPVIAAKPVPSPVPKSVCLDPGHGGRDTGAVNQDLTEKDINLEVAQLLKQKLELDGYTVYLTRTGDETLSNADRYNRCNSLKTSILVSIHHNGSNDPLLDYSQALYMKKQDVALARFIVDEISSQLVLPNHGLSRFASGVLLKANMPAAISEGFFLTSEFEYTQLKQGTRQQQEAQALFTAIDSYLSD